MSHALHKQVSISEKTGELLEQDRCNCTLLIRTHCYWCIQSFGMTATKILLRPVFAWCSSSSWGISVTSLVNDVISPDCSLSPIWSKDTSCLQAGNISGTCELGYLTQSWHVRSLGHVLRFAIKWISLKASQHVAWKANNLFQLLWYANKVKGHLHTGF